MFFALRNNLAVCDLADGFGFGIEDLGYACYPKAVTSGIDAQGPLALDFVTAKTVDDLWHAMELDTQMPLRRLVTGNRSWDFNLDGLAHHGLVPDLLQDLRNVGINARQMDALFESTEGYLQMWQKAENAAKTIP